MKPVWWNGFTAYWKTLEILNLHWNSVANYGVNYLPRRDPCPNGINKFYTTLSSFITRFTLLSPTFWSKPVTQTRFYISSPTPNISTILWPYIQLVCGIVFMPAFVTVRLRASFNHKLKEHFLWNSTVINNRMFVYYIQLVISLGYNIYVFRILIIKVK